MVNRGEQVERLIARYGLVTVEALSASLFQGLSDKAAERVLTRLLQAERILSQPLGGRRCFYLLAPGTARALGLDADRAQLGMGAQAILQHYAIMAFCLLMEPRHERLTRPEFLDKWGHVLGPQAASRSYRTRFYLDTTDRAAAGIARLALLVPDLGSHPRRLVRKARREVEKRKAHSPAAAAMIKAQLFSITVLTGFPSKARLLSAALAKESFHSRVVVVPGYDDLLLNSGIHR